MADSGLTLKLKFGTLYGEKTFSYKYAKNDVSPNDVKALMDGMIENGSIFKYPPLAKVSANLEITSVTPISVN